MFQNRPLTHGNVEKSQGTRTATSATSVKSALHQRIATWPRDGYQARAPQRQKCSKPPTTEAEDETSNLPFEPLQPETLPETLNPSHSTPKIERFLFRLSAPGAPRSKTAHTASEGTSPGPCLAAVSARGSLEASIGSLSLHISICMCMYIYTHPSIYLYI